MTSDQECMRTLGRQQTQTAGRLNGYIKYVLLIGDLRPTVRLCP